MTRPHVRGLANPGGAHDGDLALFHGQGVGAEQMDVELREQVSELRVVSECKQHRILVRILEHTARPFRKKLAYRLGHVLGLDLRHAGWRIWRQHVLTL